MNANTKFWPMVWKSYPRNEPPKNRAIVIVTQRIEMGETVFDYLIVQYADWNNGVKQVFVNDNIMEPILFSKRTAWKRPSNPVTHWAEIPQPPKVRTELRQKPRPKATTGMKDSLRR